MEVKTSAEIHDQYSLNYRITRNLKDKEKLLVADEYRNKQWVAAKELAQQLEILWNLIAIESEINRDKQAKDKLAYLEAQMLLLVKKLRETNK
jgi:hypothetical protein